MENTKLVLRHIPSETAESALRNYFRAKRVMDRAERIRAEAVKGLRMVYDSRITGVHPSLRSQVLGMRVSGVDQRGRCYILRSVVRPKYVISRDKLLAHGVSPEVIAACTEVSKAEIWLVDKVEAAKYEILAERKEP